MSSYDDRIWLTQYGADQQGPHPIQFSNVVEMFKATVAGGPERDIIRYFDGRMTARELDTLSDSFAAGIVDAGFRPGERLVLYLQNIPQFVIAQLGTWKAGGIAVAANPMYRGHELKEVLDDSGATALVALQSLYHDVAKSVVPDTAVHTIITTCELEYQNENTGVLNNSVRIACPDTVDMAQMLEAFGQCPAPAVAIEAQSVACLGYTSGTTGPPKGAMITHHNMVFNAQTYRDWIGIDASDVILGVAPLFHVTGLVGHTALALLTGAPLVLMYRMDPVATIDTIHKQRASFTVGSITVFIALLHAANANRAALASLTKIYSGGAPIPPSTITAFQNKFGHYIHNIYGLTETTSPSHAVPFGRIAPIDELTGATSVGVPIYDTVVRIVDDNGVDLPIGEVGELVTTGPEVVAGYWNKPEATAESIPGGALHTGDVGYMDPNGWFYIIDRKKDQINTGGYKVWPREVEDALYEHPAIREAAVVGVPDSYRGETVKAVVSLRPDSAATAEELTAFVRKRLAAYKCPRVIEIVADIPKTATGKLLRRKLRTAAQPTL